MKKFFNFITIAMTVVIICLCFFTSFTCSAASTGLYFNKHELNIGDTFTVTVTVTGDAVVNVTGGTYEVTDAADPGYCAVWAHNGGTVNIYGGTFI